MGRRHAGHKFMPGKFVFPGGRIERGDRAHAGRRARSSARRAGADGPRPARLGASRPRALALAAIRETFEETGLLLGTKEHGAPGSVPPARGRRSASTASFPNSRRFSSSPARSRRRAGRSASTRASSPSTATAIADEVEGVVGPDSELVELAWVTLEEARQLDLPRSPTSILEELEDRIGRASRPSCPCRSTTRCARSSCASCFRTASVTTP